MAKRIGEILQEKGYLTAEQVEESLLIQINTAIKECGCISVRY